MNWRAEKGGPFGIFQHPFCRKTYKKLKGNDPLEKNKFQKKSHNAVKTERGDPLVAPGIVCYAKKTTNIFGSAL